MFSMLDFTGGYLCAGKAADWWKQSSGGWGKCCNSDKHILDWFVWIFGTSVWMTSMFTDRYHKEQRRKWDGNESK